MSEATLQDYHEYIKAFYTDRVVGYHPNIARAVGGVKAGVMLMQLTYWNFNETAQDRGGWFYKTAEEFEQETALTISEQKTARRILEDMKLIETSLRGIPPRYWYKVNLDRQIEVVVAYQKYKTTLKPVREPRERGERGRFLSQAMGDNA